MENKIVVGLDIGSTTVCAVVGRIGSKNEHTLEVLGVGRANTSGGVVRGSVVNTNKTVEAIKIAVDEAGNQADIDIESVYASFSGAKTVSLKRDGFIIRNSTGEEVLKTDIDRLLGDMYKTSVPPGTEIMHVLPMDFTVDGERNIEDPVGRNGMKLEGDFQIITSPFTEAANTRKCITRMNLIADEVILASLASSLAVLAEDEKEAGVALVDIGGGTTEIAVYHRNVLRHVAVLPWAGDSITRDIETGCKVMLPQAEQLKLKFGSTDLNSFRMHEVVSVPGLTRQPPKDILLKNVALIINERLSEIAGLVYAELNRAGYADKLIGGIVLTGGTAQIDGIEQTFQRVTGMHARVGSPENLEHNLRADLVADPSFATAIGLVWAGLVPIDPRISFISEPNKYNTEPAPPTPTENLDRPTKVVEKFLGMFKSPPTGREADTY
jgi:cell division protein FtsA